MKILAISYSQTGQLDNIMDNFIAPLRNVDIDRISFHPKHQFPFPWTSDEFFDVMPECVFEEPIELQDIKYKYASYDLILLGYQPWFLSPSLPTTALLQDTEFLKRVNNTPVITIIGSRNMWINSQKSINARIANAGGTVIGNIPFIDKTQNFISALTILHWMLNGKKTKMFNLLPVPGVSDEDIEEAKNFGAIMNNAITTNDFHHIQEKFLSHDKISITNGIVFIERRAKKLFNIWATVVKTKGTTQKKRAQWLQCFKYYLIIALFIIAPIVLFFYTVLIVPFTFKTIKKRKNYIYSNILD